MGRLAAHQKGELERAIEEGAVIPTKQRVYEIEALQDSHRAMIRLKVMGLKQVEIAEKLGVTPQNVSDVLNSRLALAEIERLRAALDGHYTAQSAKIAEMAGRGIIWLEERMGNEDTPAAVKDKIAFDALDRAGHKAPSRLDVRQTNVELTYDDIKDMKRRVEAAMAEEEAEEAEYEEVGEEEEDNG